MDRKNLWRKAHLFCLLLYIIYKDLLEWAYFDYEIGIPFYNNHLLKGFSEFLLFFNSLLIKRNNPQYRGMGLIGGFMKIVISGYYGFDNVGDEAILLAMIQAFRSYDPTIEIVVLSNSPETTKSQFHVDAVNRWNIKEIFRALKDSDGLISGGGRLLQDETGVNSIIYYTGVIKMAEFLGLPVFIYAQGMGPLKRTIAKHIVKWALKKAKITVRDYYSAIY